MPQIFRVGPYSIYFWSYFQKWSTTSRRTSRSKENNSCRYNLEYDKTKSNLKRWFKWFFRRIKTRNGKANRSISKMNKNRKIGCMGATYLFIPFAILPYINKYNHLLLHIIISRNLTPFLVESIFEL